MKNTAKAKEAMEAKGVKFDTPRLELAKKDEKGIPQSTGKHLCTILRDEIRDDIIIFTGANTQKEVKGIRYWFDEKGVEKYYDVPLFKKGTTNEPDYRIARFSELNEGDKVVLEYVKKGDSGFISITKADGEVPTINLDEGDEGNPAGMGDGADVPPLDIPF